MYWLSQNEKFQKDLAVLRKKYRILPSKIHDLQTYLQWSNNLSIGEHLEFEKDFLASAKKCAAYFSRHSADFTNTLRMFVLTDKLGVIYNNPSHAIPSIVTKANNSKAEIKMTIHHFDTGIEEVIAELRKHWQNNVKPFQEKLSDRQMLKKEVKFQTNMQIWKMYKQGKSATQISNGMKNTEYTQQDISDILRTISRKIRKTYNQESISRK